MFVCALDWSGNINHSSPFHVLNLLAYQILISKKYGCTDLNYCFFKKIIRSIVRCCLKMCVVIKILSVVLSKKNPHPSSPHILSGGGSNSKRRRSTKKGVGLSLPCPSSRDQRNCSSEGGWLGQKEEGGGGCIIPCSTLSNPPPLRKKSVGESSAAEFSRRKWHVFWEHSRWGVGFCISLFRFCCFPVAV